MYADHTYNLSFCSGAKSIVLKSCTYDNNINRAICRLFFCGYTVFFQDYNSFGIVYYLNNAQNYKRLI